MPNELILLRNQYLVENGGQDQLPPFIPFKDSVVCTEENERLASVDVCNASAFMGHSRVGLLSKLAILKVLFKPSLDQVTENVKRVSTNVSKSADRERPETTRRLLSKVMVNVTHFSQK